MKNIKKLTLLLTLITISMFCLVFTVNATWQSNNNGNIEYSIDYETGVMYVRGEGRYENPFTNFCIKNDDSDGDVLDPELEKDYSFLYGVKTLIIDEGITEIGHCSFFGAWLGTDFFKNLETVVLPESLKKIEDFAFIYCLKLTKVYFPSNLEEIGVAAFCHTNLQNVYIPNSVNTIGKSAFSYCPNLKSITFTNALCTIEDCNKLEKIVYNNPLTDVKTIAMRCLNLKEVNFQNLEGYKKIRINNAYVKDFLLSCPNATLGYLDERIINSLESKNINYAVVTKGVSSLGALKNVKFTQKGATKQITWSALENAGYYQLYYYNNSKWEKIYVGEKLSYNVTKNGKYRVRAVNYDGTKYVYSKYVTLDIDLIDRVDISNSTVGKTSIKLTWKKLNNVTGYQVYYSTTSSSSGFKKLTNVTGTSYTVKNLTKGKTYYYKVRAYRKEADGRIQYGEFSNIRTF